MFFTRDFTADTTDYDLEIEMVTAIADGGDLRPARTTARQITLDRSLAPATKTRLLNKLNHYFMPTAGAAR